MKKTPKDPRQILLSKSLHFKPDEIMQMTDAQAWRAVYAEEADRIRYKDARATICFTGFTAAEKILFKTIAEEKSLRAVSGVSGTLKFLCVGPNAGPMKIETAKKNGTFILTEAEFYAL